MKRRVGRTPRSTERRWASSRRWIASAVVVLVALAAAPAAQARKAHSLHGVVVHLRSADRALSRLVAHPASPLAEMYLTRSASQTALAGSVAHAIVLAAHGGASSELAATVLGLFADHQTSQAQSLTSVLGQVPPELQADVARAISTATGGRGVVLGTLSGLLPALSSAARPLVAQVVAIEASQGAQVPVQIAGVLGANAVGCQAAGPVQQALVVATQAFQLGLADLGPVLALVPASVHAQVQSEIDGVPALLRQIEDQIAGLLPCAGTAPTYHTTGATAPVKALGTPALVDGMTQLIDRILASLAPGVGAGTTPAPVAVPAPLSGLLGGVGSLLGGGLGGLWPTGSH